MSYASIDGLENEAQEAHIQDSLKISKLKSVKNDNDTGLCQECGEKISEARLVAVPSAKFCIECQQNQEAKPHGIQYRNPYIP